MAPGSFFNGEFRKMERGHFRRLFGDVAESDFRFVGEGIFLRRKGNIDWRQGRFNGKCKGDFGNGFQIESP